MALRWRSGPAARPCSLLLLLPLIEAGAGARLDAQQIREVGVHAVGTVAGRSALVAGPVVALRPSSRTRVSLGAGVGASEGPAVTWRTELLGHFLLNPAERRGVGFYGAAGVAAVGGPFERGYLVLALGVEGRPGARSGWVVEVGVGGGARLGLGYRLRSALSGRARGE